MQKADNAAKKNEATEGNNRGKKPAKVFSIGNVAKDLAANIMERVEGVDAKANFDLREIPLEEISYHPENRYGMRNLEELAESLKLNGQKHNAVVRPFTSPDNTAIKYQMISGERRHRALSMIGARTIFAKVEEMDDLTALELIDVINLQTRELSEMERAEAVERLFKIVEKNREQGVDYGGKKTREVVAGMMSSDTEKLQPATVAQYKKLNELIPEFKVLVDSGDISRELGYQYAQLPEEQQKLIYNAFEQGKELTAKDAKALKEELAKKDTDLQKTVDDFKEKLRQSQEEAQDFKKEAENNADLLKSAKQERDAAQKELNSTKELLDTVTKEKEAIENKANEEIESLREEIRKEVEKQTEEQNTTKLNELQNKLSEVEKQKDADIEALKLKSENLENELKEKAEKLKEKEIAKDVTEGNKAIQSLARQAQKALGILLEEISTHVNREGFELTEETKAILADIRKYEGEVNKKR